MTREKNYKQINTKDDMENLKIGEVVSLLVYGRVRYGGIKDNMYIFLGRNNQGGIAGIREIWMDKKQLNPFRGEIGFKYNQNEPPQEELFFNSKSQEERGIYKYQDKKLLEAGL